MGITELFFLAVGVAMDAFTVAVCKGLAMEKINLRKAAAVGIWFGVFQALMPLLGFYLAGHFAVYIIAADWIAVLLLALIGINMIREALGKECCEENDATDFKTMLILSVATSIDALAAGITFACLEGTNVAAAVSMTGVITLLLSMAGVKIGNVFGARYKSRAELAGGIILILLGIKILLESI